MAGLFLGGVRSSGVITVALYSTQINQIYKILARQFGLDADLIALISGHSFWSGAAQDLWHLGLAFLT
jgi:hypothetical protein